jgi:ribonuclease HII
MEAAQGWLVEEMGLPVKPGALEEEAYAMGFSFVAGMDEVGRGPLAGPVVAAAVVLPRGISHPGIKDSKLLTAKEREVLAPWIKTEAVAWAVGEASVEEIDQLNILQASLLAMGRAFKQLEPLPDYLLIDGTHKVPRPFLQIERSRSFPCQRTIKKGDRLCLSISAASIVAKVARDQMMGEYGKLYPEYGFARHKGYSCAFHLEALSRHGPSPIHRKSFRRVREHVVDHGVVSPLFPKAFP